MSGRIGVGPSFGPQALSYTLIGLATNGALYAGYLGLTYLGTAPLAAMSMAYATGVALSFVLNGRITFAGRSSGRQALIRFITAYGIGYAFNAAGLLIAVSYFGIPHYWAQLFMVGTTAALLFILQRWWVFRRVPTCPTAQSPNRT